jgi:PAS domain S-box-containing protein
MRKSTTGLAVIYLLILAVFLITDLSMVSMMEGMGAYNFTHLFLAVLVVLISFLFVYQLTRTSRQTEGLMRQAQGELEGRVAERTADLERANQVLQQEIAERQQAERERELLLEQVEQARQRAEIAANELQVTNNMLRAIIETLPAGMVIVDSEGRVVLANPQARAILGRELSGTYEYKENVFYRMDGLRMLPEEMPLFRAIRSGEITSGLEVRVSRPDGSWGFLLLAASPVCDEAGRITHAVKVLQDITGRKILEEALRVSEERYRVQFDSFPEPLTVWSREGVLLMENLVSARNLGEQGPAVSPPAVSPPDFIGKTIFEIFGEAAAGYLERMQRVIDSGVTEMQEDVVELPAGRHYFWSSMQRVQMPGGQSAVQVVSYDITERKQAEQALRFSEEKFATVFQFSPDAICIVRKADSIVLDVNTAFTRLFGYKRGEIAGRLWTELGRILGLDRQDDLVSRFRSNRQLTDYEMELEVPQAGVVMVLLSVTMITVGGEACALVIAHDITGRKRAEQALLRVQAELAQGIKERAALEERQRLARELHDSISQTLYGISLGAHTALSMMDTDREKVFQALDYVIAQARDGLIEMRALIAELRPETLEVEGLVSALTRHAAALQARYEIGVEMCLCPEPQAPLRVKEAIYRIVQEAMHNAARHAGSTSLAVSLDCDPQRVELWVKDDGVGFDTTADYPGHLGLSSMRERARSLGGVLEIDSQPGRGTWVRAVIPL